MAEPTPTPTPTPTLTPTLTPSPTPTPTPTPAPTPAWTDGLDAAHSAFVTERGWKAPGELLTSYRNLEKLTGVPSEQIIKLPKDMADPSMKDVWTRLGKPATAADYKLELIKGSDPEFSKAMAGFFHDADVPSAMAQKVVTKYNEHITGLVAKQQADYTAKVTADQLALKTEWGGKHDSNVQIARTAAKSFGMTGEQIDALEHAMGYAGVHKFLLNIGSKIGEAEFIQGGGKPGDFSGMTVESARARINEMKKDSTYIARFNHKDPVVRGEAQAEMRRYEKIAYPGQQTI